jgi:hypothetical protein
MEETFHAWGKSVSFIKEAINQEWNRWRWKSTDMRDIEPQAPEGSSGYHFIKVKLKV